MCVCVCVCAGLFFQWVLCIGIWLVGLVVNMVRYQPPFFLPTLLGGFLWTTGEGGRGEGGRGEGGRERASKRVFTLE